MGREREWKGKFDIEGKDGVEHEIYPDMDDEDCEDEQDDAEEEGRKRERENCCCADREESEEASETERCSREEGKGEGQERSFLSGASKLPTSD
jgi:hypothetical protein